MKAAAEEPDTGWQEQLDGIVDLSLENTKEVFRRMFAPIRKLTEECEDLLSLKAALEDEGKLTKLYGDMDVTELTDLLHQGLYLAELIGRSEQ